MVKHCKLCQKEIIPNISMIVFCRVRDHINYIEVGAVVFGQECPGFFSFFNVAMILYFMFSLKMTHFYPGTR
jgi:hypothetical protein